MRRHEPPATILARSAAVNVLRRLRRGTRRRAKPQAQAKTQAQPQHLWDAVAQPPAPPPCPAGSRTGAPDFVGVGVQRAGTTRWFELLRAHPQVARTKVRKELHFFDRFYLGGFGAEEVARYHEYFPRGESQLAGEWTPIYLSAPWVAPMLAVAAPDARLLVLLRDPVERHVSGIEHSTRLAGDHGAPMSRFATLASFGRGFYHAQLVHLLRHFERERVLIQQYERCSLEPEAELRRTLRFLGLDDVVDQPGLEQHPNRQQQKPELQAAVRAAYVEAYEQDVVSLIAAFPEIDVSLWPNFAHLASSQSGAVRDAGPGGG